MTDIVETVKAALAEHDAKRCSCNRGVLGFTQPCEFAWNAGWLRALMEQIKGGPCDECQYSKRGPYIPFHGTYEGSRNPYGCEKFGIPCFAIGGCWAWEAKR